MRHLQQCIHLAVQVIALPLVLCTPVDGTAFAAPTDSAPQLQLSSARTRSAPQPIPNEQIVTRLDELRRLTQPILDQPDSPQVRELEQQAAQLLTAVDDTVRKTESMLQGTPSSEALWDLGAELKNRSSSLEMIEQRVTPLVNRTQETISVVEEALRTWKLTREGQRYRSVPRQLRTEVQEVLELAEKARDLNRRQLDRLLVVLDGVNRRNAVIVEFQEKMAVAGSQFRKSLLVPEAVPLWELYGAGRADTAMASAEKPVLLDQSLAIAGEYLSLHKKFTGVFIAFFALVLSVSIFLRRHVVAWTRDHPDFHETSQFLTRPVSLTLLVTVTIFPVLFLQGTPRILQFFIGLLLLVPVFRILPPLFTSSIRPLIYVVSFFVIWLGLRDILFDDPVLVRWVYFINNLVSLIIIVAFFHPARLRRFPIQDQPPPLMVLLGRCALWMLAVSLCANLFGFYDLSRVISRGVLASVFAALVLYGTVRALLFIMEALLDTRLSKTLRIVRSERPMVVFWSRWLFGILAALVWIKFTLRAFSLSELVLGGMWEVLTAPIYKGRISFSFWDILSFGIVLTAAIITAKIIRSLLQEELLPLVPLAKGVPTMVSTMAYYTLLLLGFILALGFAGVDVTKITILAGAFGVGIGFGLQTIVNNFISGLILLFERPIHVGDVVEVGGLLGEVQKIGTRASTIRTYEGAEVIVPNATLITDKLINWTLSEQRRRVDIKVGVAYGSDTQRVMDILRLATAGHRQIFAEPEPVVLFTGFGESSLDFELRVWTDFQDHVVVRSDLNMAVNQALAKAGIEIPFPQRDLHIRSAVAAPVQFSPAAPGDDSSTS